MRQLARIVPISSLIAAADSDLPAAASLSNSSGPSLDRSRSAARSQIARSGRGKRSPLSALLAWVGCFTDAYEQAKWFGDDIALKADAYAMAGGEVGYFVGRLGMGRSLPERMRLAAARLVLGDCSTKQEPTRTRGVASLVLTRRATRPVDTHALPPRAALSRL